MSKADKSSKAEINKYLAKDMEMALRKCRDLNDSKQRMDAYVSHIYGLYDYSAVEIEHADADAYLTESARRYSNV